VLGKPRVKSESIVTQMELETRLNSKNKKDIPNSVVMVQCAGSRGDDLGYCSKVCCNHAVKNALTLKEKNPKAQVIVLYRDMRTYGLAEEKYRQAREQGVIFIPYARSAMPEIGAKKCGVEIKFFDPILKEEVTVAPDLLVLSVNMLRMGFGNVTKTLRQEGG